MPLRDLWTSSSFGALYARSGSPGTEQDDIVVPVHGLIIASGYMVPTAERLADVARVYAPDLPGYGRSAKPAVTLTMAWLADALACWIKSAGIAKAHLVGNSFGCQIIAEFATRHPERVVRIVIQGPTVDPQARSFMRQL